MGVLIPDERNGAIRRATYITGAIVLLCLLLASTTSALRPNTTIDPCRGHHSSAKTFAPWSASVWDPQRWRRGKPPAATIEAQRQRLRCARGPGHRRAMHHRWRYLQSTYFKYRGRKLAYRHYLAAITPPGPAVLAAIRECESGGDYSIYTGNGFSGAYQFLPSTWWAVGGSGLPHEASPREQDERAARLYREQGSSPWPVCGV